MARVRTYQRLKTLSETIRGAVRLDFLTGTATRREFERVTTQEWLRASRTAAPLSLLIADIDGFGAYNAEFGEDRADLCLRRVADALRSVARRPADLIGRYAGGRFAILLPETRVSGARVVAQRAIEAVDSLQIRHAAACTRNRVTLFVGGSYREPVAGVAAEVAASIPDDLRVAAEQACDMARSASDDVARFVDVVHLRTRPPDGTTV
jgi:diguanylate cyclase (GGDEF)-like protein